MVEGTIQLSVAFQTVLMLISWKNQSLKQNLTDININVASNDIE